MKERDCELIITTVRLPRFVLELEADILMLLILPFLGSLQWNRCLDVSLLLPLALMAVAPCRVLKLIVVVVLNLLVGYFGS